MFLAGVLIAWVPLLYTFIDDEIYSDKCEHNNKTQVRFKMSASPAITEF